MIEINIEICIKCIEKRYYKKLDQYPCIMCKQQIEKIKEETNKMKG